MTNNKLIIAFIILVLTLPLLVILNNAYTTGFSESFYHNEYEKIGTYERVPDADDITINILNFFNDKEKLNYFSEKEKEHMQDVKSTIFKFFIAFTILKLVVASLIIYIRKINLLFYAFITSLILLIILSLTLYLFDFSSLFTNFHNIFFEPGTWTFSEQDLLIKLFPMQFFQDITNTVWFNSLYQLLITCIFLFILKKSIRL